MHSAASPTVLVPVYLIGFPPIELGMVHQTSWLQEEIHIKCNSTWRQANLCADILRELQNEMAELN